MKHLIKRAAALAMAMAMTLTLTTWASAADYTDMPSNWAKVPMEAAVENGLLKGDNGRLRPGDSLTRAEMAAILVRAFGADQAADLSKFTDVPADKWYAKELSSAVFMEIMKGSGSALNPEKPITREEAFAVLARALKLQNGSSATLARFTDGSSVSSWFTGEIAAMVEAGFVNGSDGKLNPKANISRQEFAQVMYNIFGVDYIKEAGTYSELGEKSVMINASGVTVKDATIHGDVIIGEGVGEGDVYFDNVTIEGRVVVRGGGVNSIHFTRSTVANVVIAKIVGNVRVVGDRTSTARIISVADGDAAVVIENLTVTTVDVASADTPVEVRSAVVTTVNVAVAGAEVSLTSNTTVTTVNVTSAAAGSTIKTQAGVTVTTVNAAVNVTVDGGGRVQNVAGTGSVTDTTGKPVTGGGSTGGGSIAIGGGSGGGGGGTTKPTTPEDPKNPEPDTKPHQHTYDDNWTTDRAATCLAAGSKSRQCTDANCPDKAGSTQTQEIPKLAHSYTGEEVDGSKKCENGCGKTEAENNACKHEGTEVDIPAVAPTCTQDGKTAGKQCTACGATTVAPTTVAATGHDVNGVAWSKDASGHWKVCKTCNAVVDSTSHTAGSYVDNKNGNHSQSCTACEWVIKNEAHSSTNDKFAADEGKDTHSKTCQHCSAKYGTANHEWAPAQSQTGTGDSVSTQTVECAGCGATKEVACSAEKNHANILKGKTCEVCGFVGTKEETPACSVKGCTCTDHTNCDADPGKCTNCDACKAAQQEKCEHNYVNGTCTKCDKTITTDTCPDKDTTHSTMHEGVTCSKCGYQGQVEHTYSNGKCTGCDATITAETCPDNSSHGNIETGSTCPKCGYKGTKDPEQTPPSK